MTSLLSNVLAELLPCLETVAGADEGRTVFWSSGLKAGHRIEGHARRILRATPYDDASIDRAVIFIAPRPSADDAKSLLDRHLASGDALVLVDLALAAGILGSIMPGTGLVLWSIKSTEMNGGVSANISWNPQQAIHIRAGSGSGLTIA